jgi:hypothetical protein
MSAAVVQSGTIAQDRFLRVVGKPNPARHSSRNWTVGATVAFEYLIDGCLDHVGEAHFRPTVATILRCRDLVKEPIPAKEWLADRDQVVGRFGFEAETGDGQGVKTFYPNATEERFRIVPVQLALYEPNATKPLSIVSRPYGATLSERFAMDRRIRETLRRDLADLTVAVLATDLCIAGRQDEWSLHP